jgi:hypothetical protein
VSAATIDLCTSPITVDQAITSVRGAGWFHTVDGEDESGDIWADAKLVAVRCDQCGRVLDARGRWSAKAIPEHRPECNAAESSSWRGN